VWPFLNHPFEQTSMSHGLAAHQSKEKNKGERNVGDSRSIEPLSPFRLKGGVKWKRSSPQSLWGFLSQALTPSPGEIVEKMNGEGSKTRNSSHRNCLSALSPFQSRGLSCPGGGGETNRAGRHEPMESSNSVKPGKRNYPENLKKKGSREPKERRGKREARRLIHHYVWNVFFQTPTQEGYRKVGTLGGGKVETWTTGSRPVWDP